MLFGAGLGKLFWADAVATASYVINRSPTKGLQITGSVPICGTYVFSKASACSLGEATKMGRQIIALHLQGHSENSETSTVYNLKTQEIAISRDVKFL